MTSPILVSERFYVLGPGLHPCRVSPPLLIRHSIIYPLLFLYDMALRKKLTPLAMTVIFQYAHLLLLSDSGNRTLPVAIPSTILIQAKYIDKILRWHPLQLSVARFIRRFESLKKLYRLLSGLKMRRSTILWSFSFFRGQMWCSLSLWCSSTRQVRGVWPTCNSSFVPTPAHLTLSPLFLSALSTLALQWAILYREGLVSNSLA